MKWIVGLDLRTECQGAVYMAAWLDSLTEKPARQRLIAVHIIEWPYHVPLRDDAPDEVLAVVRETAMTCIKRAEDPPARFAVVQATLGKAAESSLNSASEYYGADAILIGRHGPRDGSAIVRLGGVARRLLRTLPRPVMVVPPDLEPSQIGKGSILAATDLTLASVAACRVALELARETKSDLTIVHVKREPEMMPGVPPSDEEDTDLDGWVREHGLAGARTVLDSGDVLDRLLAVAEKEDAPIVVCGSRRLTLGQRLFGSSLGTDLARMARCGVLVVPPEALAKHPG